MKSKSLTVVLTLAVLGALVLAGPVTAATTTLSATLSGASEVNGQGEPNQGDPDGAGTAEITLKPKEKKPKKSKICFDIAVSNIQPATMAHIHEAPAGENGPIVVTLEAPGEDGQSSGCVKAKLKLIKDIEETPSDYYVNVHNGEFSAGAVRGQLSEG